MEQNYLKIDYEMYKMLNEFEDAEDLTKTVVIYPGRFHPFHKGHASVYNKLQQATLAGTAEPGIGIAGRKNREFPIFPMSSEFF